MAHRLWYWEELSEANTIRRGEGPEAERPAEAVPEPELHAPRAAAGAHTRGPAAAGPPPVGVDEDRHTAAAGRAGQHDPRRDSRAGENNEGAEEGGLKILIKSKQIL